MMNAEVIDLFSYLITDAQRYGRGEDISFEDLRCILEQLLDRLDISDNPESDAANILSL